MKINKKVIIETEVRTIRRLDITEDGTVTN